MANLRYVKDKTAAGCCLLESERPGGQLQRSTRSSTIFLVPPKLRGVSTESTDNYLKAILELSGQEEVRVTSNAIAHQHSRGFRDGHAAETRLAAAAFCEI